MSVNLLRKDLHLFCIANTKYQTCRERIRALKTENEDSRTASVFQTALRPDKMKGSQAPSLKELSADALLFFVAGEAETATCYFSPLNAL